VSLYSNSNSHRQSNSVIYGQLPSNEILFFRTKVCPKTLSVVSEPTLFGFAPLDSTMVYLCD